MNATYRFEALFNHASMGIVLVDGKGVIQSVNPFALKLFGYNLEEIINEPIEKLIPQRYHHKHVHHRDAYIDHPKSRPMGVGMDLYAIKKDCTEFPVEVSLGNYKINEEENVIAFISDITIRKRAEKEIEKLNNELEITVEQRTRDLKDTLNKLEEALEKEKELGELKSRFVSMASHEFRTPLSTVLSSAFLIEKYVTEEDQPKREKHIQRIVSSVNMLTDTLNDFLSADKIEEGKIQVRMSQFDLPKQIAALIEEIKNNLKKQQSIVYNHLGPNEVILDISLLKHIVMNLISNASKFSPEESIIEITTNCEDNNVLLSVKDEGIGISKEDQKHLMEPFFRGANVSNIQGTGLGLHIVSKYAELMGGTLTYKSELEKGTEFLIIFKSKIDLNEKGFTD